MTSTKASDLVQSNGAQQIPIRKLKWAPPSVSAVSENNSEAMSEIIGYLKRFGDWPKDHADEEGIPHAVLSDALQNLQRTGGIPQTGVFDEATAALMAMPRCPIKHKGDLDTPKESVHDHLDAGTATDPFLHYGTKWGHTQLTYRFDNVTPDFNGGDAYTAIQKAMSQWSNIIPVTFVEVLGTAAADVVFSWTFGDRGDGTSFDGPGTVVGYAMPSDGHSSVTVRFDEAEDWNDAFLYQCALHELGHTLGLAHNDAANPLAVMNPILQGFDHLQPYDIAAVQSIYGRREPAWQLIDNNPATASIHSASSGIGFSQATDGLYQRHSTGRIWHYTGPPMTGWFMMDDNPLTVQISASGGQVYQRRSNGTVLHWIQSLASWEVIDNSGHATDILAVGWNLYVRRFSSGIAVPLGTNTILRYTGTPITGWDEIDRNSFLSSGITEQIAGSTNGQLYQRRSNAEILQYDTSTSPASWKSLDNNPNTRQIAAGGDWLYQLHKDGSIFFYDFTARSWKLIDNNPATVEISAAGNYVYQRHNTGLIWRYAGLPIVWQFLDGNANTISIVGDDNGSVWQLQRGGLIYRRNS